MILSVCVILIFIQKIADAQSLAFLGGCSEDSQCSHLRNASCLDEACDCGQEFFVCEYVLMNANLGEKCNVTQSCGPKNSECNPENVCVCKKGFVKSSDTQRCLPLPQNIKDNCENSDQCQEVFTTGAQCLRNICLCKNDYRYSFESRKCVRNAILGDVCGSHEECNLPEQESDSRLMCIEGQCKCKLGYSEEYNYCKENSAQCLEGSAKFQVFILSMVLIFFIVAN